MRSQRNPRGAIDPLPNGDKLILNNYKEDTEIFSKTALESHVFAFHEDKKVLFRAQIDIKG